MLICLLIAVQVSDTITRLEATKIVGDKVVPVFISIDTKRDTPDVVKEYVKGIGMRVATPYACVPGGGPCWMIPKLACAQRC